MAYWPLNAQQIRSFIDWNPSFESINGPRSYVSFSSREDRIDGPPMYWMEKETALSCIEKAQQENDIDSFYEFIRQGVALREDWGNNLMWAFELTVEKDQYIHAWTGLAQAQQVAMKARRLQERIKEGRSLFFWGGFQQYLVDQCNADTRPMVSSACLTESLINSLPNSKNGP